MLDWPYTNEATPKETDGRPEKRDLVENALLNQSHPLQSLHCFSLDVLTHKAISVDVPICAHPSVARGTKDLARGRVQKPYYAALFLLIQVAKKRITFRKIELANSEGQQRERSRRRAKKLKTTQRLLRRERILMLCPLLLSISLSCTDSVLL